MTTKRLYLDVDGVLNAFPYATSDDMRKGVFADENPWGDDWKRGEARDYIITWSPRLVDAINEALAHPDGPELRWTTTWEHLAPEYIRPLLGIEVDPEREFVVERGPRRMDDYGPSITWKMARLLDIYETMRADGDEPLAWVHIDDEFHKTDDFWGTKHYADVSAVGHGGLIIGPDPALGITPEDWARATAHWDI